MNQIQTPYFLFNTEKIIENTNFINKLQSKVDFIFLYSIKSLSHASILSLISNKAEGFSVSSLFEAKLSRMYANGIIQFVSPAIKECEIEYISKLCDKITLNSISQFNLLKGKTLNTSLGLRVNPGLSFVQNEKYDPCRENSKLGIPIPVLKKFLSKNKEVLDYIEGFHIHNNCESLNFIDLVQTMKFVESHLGIYMRKLKWFNLGGGYLFNDKSKGIDLFLKTISQFKETYNLEIIIEPGNSIIKDTGYLITSVLDIIKRNSKQMAILDTSVNHLPEVFEYQYEPDILEHGDNFINRYLLAGRTCLSGDLFGEYSFKKILKIGDRITFQNVGSYSLVKAHMFNGINLPAIYMKNNKKIEKVKEYSFEDYLSFHKTESEEKNDDIQIFQEKSLTDKMY